jgi:MFS family permease
MAVRRPSPAALPARVLLAIGVALALADASIVTLALPEILERLDTTVEGLAAVIGVYTAVLAVAVLVAVPVRRLTGSRALGLIGMVLFSAASVVCGGADDLTTLLWARGAQAVGAGAALVAAFALMGRGADGRPSGLWVAAAVFGTAIGPALGGALTQLFDWRAIFLAQAPIGLLAAAAALVRQPEAAGDGADAPASSGGRAADAGHGAADAPGGTLPAPPAWPSRAPAGPRSQNRPAPPDAPTRVHRPGEAETVVDPLGARPRAPAVPPDPGSAAPGAGAGRTLPRITFGGVRAGVALALVSAALTSVVFLLVLLLVSGWSVEPLKAAVGVSLLPAAAVVGWRIPGDAWVRACVGCGLVGAGVLALGTLPTVGWVWVVLPQVLAGVGMGLALPALAGELLPERTPAQAGGLLSLRHVGITVALLALAPVTAQQLETTVDDVREQVAALVLDARLPPREKLASVGGALGDVSTENPRASLQAALDKEAPRFAKDREDAAVYAALTTRADETLVTAINGAFRPAFLITGGLALLAALIALPPLTRRPVLAAASVGAVAVALGLAGGQALLARDHRPDPVVIADPCRDRDLPSTGGLDGLIQDGALKLLDRAACRYGSSREELALAIGDDAVAREYEREHGTNPRKVPGLLGGAVAGGDGGGRGRVEEILDGIAGLF